MGRTGHEKVSPPGLVFQKVDPHSADAVWCLEQYYAELRVRFEEGFDPVNSAVADPDAFVPPGGVFVLARLEGRPVGCGAVKLTSKDVGYIKRMWVDASHRGLGLGREMLEALEEAARELGCSVVQLETNRSLTGAMRLYRTAGYREVEPFNDEYYAHHWFEKVLAPKAPE